MKNKRNPFKMRSSENIDSDDAFVKLFSPDVLEAFANQDMWHSPMFIQDPPGGGKTTFLHLFTPRVLWNIITSSSKSTSIVFKSLVSIGAIDEYKPKVIGVYLSCSRTYSTIEEINGDQYRKELVFNSLLNIRILLAVLINVCAFARLPFPEGLERLTFSEGGLNHLVGSQESSINGKTLHQWSSAVERNICEALDSFDPIGKMSLILNEALAILSILESSSIMVDGRLIDEKILIMLDNLQELSGRQRRTLRHAISNSRSSIAIWTAERYEALSTSEILPDGSWEGRDFEGIVRISRRLNRRFGRITEDIAERRAENSTVRDNLLSSGLVTSHTEKDVDSFFAAKQALISEIESKYPKYKVQLERALEINGSVEDQAIYLRGLTILGRRDLTRRQISLFESLPVTDQEVGKRLTPSILESAKLFLSQEYNIPYYYGFDTLTSLSSYNIQQFLWLAADLFEDLISSSLIKQEAVISPERQELIMLSAIRKQWESLAHSQGIEVRNLLGAIGQYCQTATYIPNASYAPGVTGIGISEQDRIRLTDPKELSLNPDLRILANAITKAVANNFLEPKPEMRAKSKTTLVLYLNRAWCAHFRLPLGYGGWRERPLNDLMRWAEKGRITQRDEARLIDDTQ